MQTASFSDVDRELQALEDNFVSLSMLMTTVQGRVPDLTAAMAELATLRANLEIRIAAVEGRLTARESAHQALVSQLQDILTQMQAKLNGALELKPEIMPYDTELAKGYTDPQTGIKLRADANAQRKFTSQLLLLRTAVEYAGAPTSMPVHLWDYFGQSYVLPFTDYVGLILRYGQYIAEVEARF